MRGADGAWAWTHGVRCVGEGYRGDREGTTAVEAATVSVELSGDGVSDTYTCAYSIGNTSLHSENYCYSAENYIVYVGGEHYIYSFSSSGNDYMSLEVVDVEKKFLEEGRSVNASLYRPMFSWSEEGDYDMRSTGGVVFTDPGHMVLERRMEDFSMNVPGQFENSIGTGAHFGLHHAYNGPAAIKKTRLWASFFLYTMRHIAFGSTWMLTSVSGALSSPSRVQRTGSVKEKSM